MFSNFSKATQPGLRHRTLYSWWARSSGLLYRVLAPGILDAGTEPDADLETHEDSKHDLFLQSGLESQEEINIKAFPRHKHFTYKRRFGNVLLS